MESKTKNKKSRTQIERMAARAFDGLGLAPGDDAIAELKEGWFNAAYSVRLADDREVILKIAPPVGADVMQYEKNIMVTEVAAMRLVRQNPAIPVPAIYCYDDALDLCDAPYFFMEKIDGDNLEHVKASLPLRHRRRSTGRSERSSARSTRSKAPTLAMTATPSCAARPGAPPFSS